MDVLVDTNLLIDYSKEYSEDLESLFQFQKKGTIHLFINSIVVLEYLSGIEEEDMDIALQFLSQFECVSIDAEMSIVASRLVQKKALSFWKDALIAASCMIEDAQFATKNIKHFKNIKGLKLYEF